MAKVNFVIYADKNNSMKEYKKIAKFLLEAFVHKTFTNICLEWQQDKKIKSHFQKILKYIFVINFLQYFNIKMIYIQE